MQLTKTRVLGKEKSVLLKKGFKLLTLNNIDILTDHILSCG